MKTVIFDFDGTLADSLNIILHIYNELAEKYDFNKITDVKTVRGLGAFEFWRYSGASIFKIPLLVGKGRRMFGKEVEHLKIFPGVKPMLSALKKNCRLGILTSNSRGNVVKWLEKNKLDDVFDFIYAGSSLFGKRKVLKRAMKAHKLEPEETIYVGDETRDIHAAKRVGVKVVVVGWGFNTRKRLAEEAPDAIVSTPRELIEVVNRLDA